MMFSLEQEVIARHRPFWCGIALRHSYEWYNTSNHIDDDDFWHNDLYQYIKLPVITRAAWDEMVSWKRLMEADKDYKETRSRFSDELDEQEINWFELGSDLRIRGR